MPVIELKRGEDRWLLQVGDLVHDKQITDEEAREHALRVANGYEVVGGEILPGNGEPGWEIVDVHHDDNFHELYGVRNEDLQ